MRIVILGAGYAGLRAALDLGHARIRGDLPESTQITLVERTEGHHLIFWLHQVAAGTITLDDARIGFDRLPLDGITRHRAEVQALDPDQQRIVTTDGHLDYDHLILALGAEAAVANIPGLAEHGHTLRDPTAAKRLHNALESAFARAGTASDPAEKHRLATVAVAGGGFTGCQLAGELAQRLPDLADRHGVPVQRARLVLLESADRLLPQMDACHGRAARRILGAKGVAIRLGSPLEQVTEDTLTAAGQGLAYGTLAWAGGIRGPGLLAEGGLPLDNTGRVVVDEYLRVPEYPAILAAGDCAVRSGAPAAEATATEAMRQGRYLASALRAELNGRALPAYRAGRLGLLVALGHRDAVGTLGPVPVSGRPAGIVKNAAEGTYPDTLTRAGPETAFGLARPDPK